MNDTIHILCATDANYANRIGVMLISLFESNRENKLFVHVFVDNKQATIWRKYQKIASKYEQQIEIIEVQKKTLSEHGAFESGYFTLAIYYRLLASELLSTDIEKIIYMDGDIIVTGNISELWEINIDNKAMAVCPDFKYFDESNYERVHYSGAKRYFNSGVLLLNLLYWREYNIPQRCLEYLRDHTSEVIYMDQDVLNAVLIDEIVWMDWKNNLQVFCVENRYFTKYDADLQQQIRNCYKCPLIIHYVGPVKPWHYKYRGRVYANIWLKYQLHSPWPFAWGIGPGSFGKLINYIGKRTLWIFGLCKRLRGIYPEFAKDI